MGYTGRDKAKRIWQGFEVGSNGGWATETQRLVEGGRTGMWTRHQNMEVEWQAGCAMSSDCSKAQEY
jgi:hypothetical protein